MSIKKLRQLGYSRGWQWELDGVEMQTNGNAEGWFEWNTSRTDLKQRAGTCQFSLPRFNDNPKTKKRVYDQIRRYFS